MVYRDKLYALDHNNYSDLKSIIYSKQQHDSLNLCDLQPWFATSKKNKWLSTAVLYYRQNEAINFLRHVVLHLCRLAWSLWLHTLLN